MTGDVGNRAPGEAFSLARKQGQRFIYPNRESGWVTRRYEPSGHPRHDGFTRPAVISRDDRAPHGLSLDDDPPETLRAARSRDHDIGQHVCRGHITAILYNSKQPAYPLPID